MLFGEHAVLYGQPAIVTAVDRYLTLTLERQVPNLAPKIHIVSEDLLDWQGTLAQLDTIPASFKYLKAALELYHVQGVLKPGFRLTIRGHRTFPSDVGLGSSAAVTAGVVALLERWVTGEFSRAKTYLQALKVVRKVATFASGADVAASIYGTTLFYHHSTLANKARVRPIIKPLQLAKPVPVQLFYVGYKTVSADVIRKVQKRFHDMPSVLTRLTNAMGEVTRCARHALQQGNLVQLGQLMRVHQGLQYSLGTSDAHLDAVLSWLNAQREVYGAKISGAGLGDCVVALCNSATTLPPTKLATLVPVAVNAHGLRWDKQTA